jgi:hypothetical protein
LAKRPNKLPVRRDLVEARRPPLDICPTPIDEYRVGRPIRELQNLLGHKSVRTTEIYLKELIPETVRPNERPMIAGSK